MPLPPDYLAHFSTATWIEALAPLLLPHERIDLSLTDFATLLKHANR